MERLQTAAGLQGLLDPSAELSRRDPPPRVLAISVFALVVATVSAFLRPQEGAEYAGLLWVLALVPPFLLAFYRGWEGAVVALGLGMMALVAAELGGRFLLEGSVDWWIFGVSTLGLIVVSLGVGAVTELLHRGGTDPTGAARMELQRREIRAAVEEGQLALHFQPIVALEDGRTRGVEALVRWRHPRLGLVDPGAFVAFAESAGLMGPVGEWVMEEAFRHFDLWRRRFPSRPDLFLGLNLTASQCRQAGFVERTRELLSERGMEASTLQLEVTEATLQEAGTQLAQLERMGVRIAIDDFGKGHVPLGQLARLRVHALKIDGSFVRAMTESGSDLATVRSIVQIAHNLELEVTAEEVETEEQVEILREMGCDLGQGYYFAEPVTAGKLEARLAAPDATKRKGRAG